MLPNKHCHFSAAQLDKVYHAEGVAAQSLSSVTMLQVAGGAHTGTALAAGKLRTELLDEILVTANFILRMSRYTILARKIMGTTVVGERNSPTGLFGSTLEAMQVRFEAKNKQW